jgi:hypothetical protein
MVFGFVIFPFALLIGLLLLGLSGKSEPDPTRERPTALYFSVVTLIGALMLLGATYLTVNGLVELTNTAPTEGFAKSSVTLRAGPRNPFDQGSSSFSSSYGSKANHDDDISQVIGGLIAGAIAAGLLWFHLPKLQKDLDDSHGPGARVYSRVLYLICGAALLTGLAAAAAAVFAVYGMIAPDTAGVGATTDALRSFISSGALAVAAVFVFSRAWSRSEDLASVVRPSPSVEPAE